LRLANLALLLTVTLAALFGSPLGSPQASAQGQRGIALFVIVDTSGSMDEYDRFGERWTATKLLVSLLSRGDQLAVVSFSTDAKPFTGAPEGSYSPVITIGEGVSQSEILDDLTAFAGDPAGTTNMAAAFDMVTGLVDDVRSDVEPYIVFLTDGVPDANAENSEAKLLKKVQAIKRKGTDQPVPIFAGGLFPGLCNSVGTDAERGMGLLNNLTRSVGGQATCVNNVEDLPRFFLRSFGEIDYRNYQEPPNESFEVTEAQRGLVSSATFIYVGGPGSNCTIPAPEESRGLCTTIERDGRPLTADDFRNQPGVLSDPRFFAMTVDNPAGRWNFPDGGRWHVIARTSLRLELGVPSLETRVNRQPLDQPIPVQARFWRQEGGGEAGADLRQSPRFSAQLRQVGGQVPAVEFLFDKRNGQIFSGEIPPLAQAGRFEIELSAVIDDFTFRQTQVISIEPFPSVTQTIEDNRLVVARDGQARLSLETAIAGAPEPVAGIDSRSITLTCDNVSVPIQMTPTTSTRYDVSFAPPAQQLSRCSFTVDGQLEHKGDPYRLRQPLAPFTLEVVPVLRVLGGESHDVGTLLPLSELTLPGPRVRLAADEDVTVTAQVQASPLSGRYNVKEVRPARLLSGQEEQLEIVLSAVPGVPGQYGPAEIVVQLQTSPDVRLIDPQGAASSSVRYSLNLVQPQIVHSLPRQQALSAPFARWDEAALSVPITISSTLVTTGTLQARLTTDLGVAPVDLGVQIVALDAEGLGRVLASDELPMSAKRELMLQIQPPAGPDPFPQQWLRDTPVRMLLVLNPGGDIDVKPVQTVELSGTRLSRINAFRRDFAPLLDLARTLAIMAVMLWVGWIAAWVAIIQRSYRAPMHYLTPVTLQGGVPSREQGRAGIALASLSNRLRHRLFGVHLAGPSDPRMRHLLPRSLGPAAVIAWLLGADRVDFDPLPVTHPLNFRILSRDNFGRPDYEIENVGPEPLMLVRSRDESTLEQGTRQQLTPGMVIVTDQGAGYQLVAPPETSRPSRTEKRPVGGTTPGLRQPQGGIPGTSGSTPGLRQPQGGIPGTSGSTPGLRQPQGGIPGTSGSTPGLRQPQGETPGLRQPTNTNASPRTGIQGRSKLEK